MGQVSEPRKTRNRQRVVGGPPAASTPRSMMKRRDMRDGECRDDDLFAEDE
jgi:hypothetical protein